MTGDEAIAALETTFARKRPPAETGRMVGVFGNGLPAALPTALGFVPIDVKMAPEDELTDHAIAIIPYLEPFIDDYARIFLHRLFSGRFDDLHAIVFCRDDAAALVAYQYALELKRQGIGRTPCPRLLLWNLVHRESQPASAFNLAQAKKLGEELSADASYAELPSAAADETARRTALSALDDLRKADRKSISATQAFVWRNAGRYLPASDHGRLLELACKAAARWPKSKSAQRIGLIGSPVDSTAFHAMLDEVGNVVTDLQPFGEAWPGPTGGETVVAMLQAEAGDRLCPRFEPATAYRDAIIDRCVADRCDLVVAQLDQNDDSVGWDLPSLERSLRDHGIPLVNLGFRDHRPDAAWLRSASETIAAAAGVPA